MNKKKALPILFFSTQFLFSFGCQLKDSVTPNTQQTAPPPFVQSPTTSSPPPDIGNKKNEEEMSIKSIKLLANGVDVIGDNPIFCKGAFTGDDVYFIDKNRIRLLLDGKTETVSGSIDRGFKNGHIDEALFDTISSCYVSNKKIYVLEFGNQKIRLIDLDKQTVSTFVENSQDNLDNIQSYGDLLVFNEHVYYMDEYFLKSRIDNKISILNSMQNFAATPKRPPISKPPESISVSDYTFGSYPSLTNDETGNLYFSDHILRSIYQFNIAKETIKVLDVSDIDTNKQGWSTPLGITYSKHWNGLFYIADGKRLFYFDLENQRRQELAFPPENQSEFSHIAVTDDGKNILVADRKNNQLQKITLEIKE